MNQFCHISVIYPESMHPELSNGMLANIEYQRQNMPYRRTEILEKLRSAGRVSPGLWYSFGRALMRSKGSDDIRSYLETDSIGVEVLLNVLDDKLNEYGEIWKDIRPRLEEYRRKFTTEWSAIGDRVLSKLSRLAKEDWSIEEVVVHFVDCLYGGFGWVDSIALTPVPEMDVEKKLLTHELSELITPQSLVGRRLREAGLDPGILHTVVDMVAYFSVKEFLANPERKGMKPNPSYYPAVDTLYPLFEAYSAEPSRYDRFGALLDDLILKLEKS